MEELVGVGSAIKCIHLSFNAGPGIGGYLLTKASPVYKAFTRSVDSHHKDIMHRYENIKSQLTNYQIFVLVAVARPTKLNHL